MDLKGKFKLLLKLYVAGYVIPASGSLESFIGDFYLRQIREAKLTCMSKYHVLCSNWVLKIWEMNATILKKIMYFHLAGIDWFWMWNEWILIDFFVILVWWQYYKLVLWMYASLFHCLRDWFFL